MGPIAGTLDGFRCLFKARRLLDQLNAATVIETLKIPPSNKLSKLTGDLKEFWRIKIDKQWAIVFM